MHRVRRTRKSPSPSEEANVGAISRPSFSMLSSDSSPILSRTSFSAGAGGGTSYMYTRSNQSLLQSVIRNLVDSEDDHDRKTQRMKLESDLEVTSERLDALVQEHRDKLHGTLSTFDAVDEKIRDSQEKIRRVKLSLKSCKSLLRCKREELKRLWLEDVKYKHMLQMVDSIEEVRSVPEKLIKFKASKHYLQATELLKNSVARLEGELASVDALKELKYELIQQKENLHEELIEELHRHLYVKAPLHQKHHIRTVSDGSGSTGITRKATTLTRGTPALTAQRLPQEVGISEGSGRHSEEVGDVDPERDSHRYMAVLVEALSILGKVQDALDAIQKRMEKEFLLIIEKASIQVTRIRDQEEGQGGRRGRVVVRENLPKQLTKMLQICFERFHAVVSAHEVLLSHFQRTKSTYKAPYILYRVSDVWVAIQRVVQSALEVYLAYEEESTPTDMGAGYAAFASPGDAHSMFSRRKPATARVTKKPLFRFESSRHALSINSYMREQRDLELTGGGEGGSEPVPVHQYEQDQPSIAQHLVCTPHSRNITVVFRVVRNFVEEIEEALCLDQLHCQLYLFLHEYVENHFLERVRLEYFDKMSSSAKPEAAKTTAPDQKTLKVTGSKLCVLNSVLTVWQLVVELRQLMKDLPLYSSHFLAILCEILVGYKESLQLLYKGLTSVPVETAVGGRGVAVGGGSVPQEGVVSSKWACDEEITGPIKSLSTWIKVKQSAKVKGGSEEERVQTVYSKESDLLTKHLVEALRKHNVILSHDSLRLLAIFHESLDWFSGQLKQVVFDMTSEERSPGSPQDVIDGGAMSSERALTVSEDLDLLEQFSSVQLEFQSLAETAIIMLHLEVRCHCFYYLWPAVQRASYVFEADAVEADGYVEQLVKDLRNIDQVMVAVLSQDKYRYLFEGVGHLVAAIFIASTKHIKHINTNGIKKMCRNILVLQSCLSKITLVRERELDRARKYFEMLYLTFDEITEGLLEHGAIYSAADYKRALTLMAHSNLKGEGLTGEELTKRLEQEHQQLDAIFSRDTV